MDKTQDLNFSQDDGYQEKANPFTPEATSIDLSSNGKTKNDAPSYSKYING